MPPRTPEGFRCVIEPYEGTELRVLEMRNQIREVAQTREFLNWRYERSAGAPPSEVCWLRSAAGEDVGMAGIIHRPYWSGMRRIWLPVVGDIGLRPQLRGKGVGRVLLEGLTRHLRAQLTDGPALVIPTEMARRGLAAAGWQTAGILVPHVFPITADGALPDMLRGETLARVVGRVYARAVGSLLRVGRVAKPALVDAADFDSGFDALCDELPRANLVQRAYGSASLTWRYARHPYYRFAVCKLMLGERLAGYIVHSRDRDDCAIADLAVADPSLQRPFLAEFLLRALDKQEYRAVRVVISDKHPARSVLRRLCFIPRPAVAEFQALPAIAAGTPPDWALSLGDKDV